MKALVYVGEEKLDFREVADPVVNSGEQLIKLIVPVYVVLICMLTLAMMSAGLLL